MLATALVQVIWLFALLLKPLLHTEIEKAETSHVPVSVIVVAKNEKENLQELLPQILEQDYPSFELIVVDDHSWDGTYEYLYELKAKHSNIDVIALDEFVNVIPGKKLSLTLAIKKAKNDVLLFTDADCVPTSDQWIAEMTKHFKDQQVEVVLGYSPYQTKGSYNPFIGFETFWVAWQYMAYALSGAPYMGVGRNLVYRKSTFMANKGFASHLKVPYGDDDLLIQEIANKENTKVVLNPEAFIESIPTKGINKWRKQKRRHLSAGSFYKFKFKFSLGLLWLSRFGFYAAAIIYLIAGSPYNMVNIGLIILPILLQWLISGLLHRKFKMYKFWPAFPLLDLLYQCVVYPILGLITMLNPQKKTW